MKKPAVVNLDEEDWLAPPPLKPVARADACNDKTLHQPRYSYVLSVRCAQILTAWLIAAEIRSVGVGG